MAGYQDLLTGRAGPMDLRSLAGQMGMGSQMETAGGPVQGMAMPPPGGMDMMAQMGGPMQGMPPTPGPMGGPGMQGMLQEGPPSEMSPESGVGLKTLLEFSKLEDGDIIQLVIATKTEEEVPETLMMIGEQLGRPTLIQAGQMIGGGGMEAPVQGMGEGMVG